MDNNTFTSSSVNSALQRIKNTLAYSLRENYGITDEETINKFLKLHGLDKDRFDFINNFETLIEKGIADESVDANANKSDVSITGMFAETAMPINKLVGYRYLYRKLKDMYGKKRAKYLTGRMYDMSLALADSTNILKPYSYYGNTPIYIEANGVESFITLKELFNKYSNFSHYDAENDMDVIYTEDIKKDVLFHKTFMYNKFGRAQTYDPATQFEGGKLITERVILKVWDDKNGFVNVSRIVRHHSNVDMTLYQTEKGDFSLVTNDHPVILEDGSTKNASDLQLGDCVMNATTTITPKRQEMIDVPEKLAYFLGFMAGDGNFKGFEQDKDYIDSPVGCIKFTRGNSLATMYQKDIAQSRIFQLAKELFPEAHMWTFSKESEPKVRCFSNWTLSAICAYYFEYGVVENSFTKHLPKNIMSWKKNSIYAFIAGLIDADGTVQKADGRCLIRVMSLPIISELKDVLDYCGIPSWTYVNGSNRDNFVFAISFKPNERIYDWCEKCWSVSREVSCSFQEKYGHHSTSNKICKIIPISRDRSTSPKAKSFFFDELEYVYDITTETGHFVANGMIQHNCFSVNASKLVYEGRPWGTLPSGVPHRVNSYINALCETVHQLSNHLAGAIAVGSFSLDLAHIIIYREHKTLSDIKNDETYRKYLENSLQSFIHSVNMLSRNSVESPFTNISIYDRPKLRGLISDDNMGWYFDKEDVMDGTPTEALNDCGDEDWKEYVIKVITELQEIYCDIMDRGDVLHDNRPIEFPVCTVNFSRMKDSEGNYCFEDPEFVETFCKKHDTPRYNIYVSEGNKCSSCCFSGDQVFTYYDKDNNARISSFEDFAKDYLSDTTQTEEKHIENSKKYVVDPQTGEKCEITGVLRLNNDYKKLLEIELEDGSILKVTPNQKLWDNNSQSLVEASRIMENPEMYDI